tara:strand:- start:374 stop:1219 length:846 start_codon:yes stop_codon:yes gene_type:complete
MNYRVILNKGTSILRNNSILTPSIDAELLLSKLIKKSREKILLNLDEKISFQQERLYFDLINRRKKKEPISCILGNKPFWKYEFKVDKNVLTPRPETELLVEEVLKINKNSDNLSILDIGLGSGCILISILKEKKNWKGTGIDISKLAVNTAKTNAKIQQVDNRIKFINTDVDKLNNNKYDLIVSNPPYINKIGYNNLDLGVKNYEPKKALYGGLDGLSIIEKIVNKSRFILKIRGLLALEIGFGQYYKVNKLLNDNNFHMIKIVHDYQKIKRCLIAKKIK